MTHVRHTACLRHGRKRKHVRFCRVDGGYLWFYSFVMLACFVFCMAKIVIGSLYVHTCPAQPMVPVYLIVGGIIPLFLFLTCRLIESNKPGKYMILCYDRREGIVVLVVGLIFTCWLSVGTYFVTVTMEEVGASKTMNFNTTSVNTTSEYLSSTTITSSVDSSNTATHSTNTDGSTKTTYDNTTIGYTDTTIIPGHTTMGSTYTTRDSTHETHVPHERKRLKVCNDFILKFSYSVMIMEWCVLVICVFSYPMFYLLMMLFMVVYYYCYDDDL